MSPLVATGAFAVGILGLFVLSRDPKAKVSMALWIPVLWMLINGSRPVTEWLQIAPLMGTADAQLDGSPVDAAVFEVLLAAGLIVVAARRQRVAALLRVNGPLILFFAYCAISILWSDFPFVAFKRWTKAIGDPVMVLVVLTDLDWRAATKRFLERVAFLLLPVSILLIKNYPEFGRAYSRWDGTLFNTGVTNNKNLLGMDCLIFGLAVLWRFLVLLRDKERGRKTGPLIAHAVALGFAVWVLWISNSMTSMTCFALAGSLLVVTSFPGLLRRRWLIHAMVVATLALASSVLFLDAGGGLLKAIGRDPTLTGRTDVWADVLKLTKNPLLGTGFESFWLGPRLDVLWSKYWWHPNEAHDGYLELYLNLGWVGVSIMAVVIFTGYRNVIRMLRWDPEGARLRLAYFSAALAYNFTEAGFRMMHPVWFFFLFASIAVPKPVARKVMKMETGASGAKPRSRHLASRATAALARQG